MESFVPVAVTQPNPNHQETQSMTRIHYLLFVLLLSLVTLPAAQAATGNDGLAQARDNIRAIFPELKPEAIQPTPIPGLYQVTLGANLVYLSGDARYAVQGSIIDLKTRSNLTEQARTRLRREAIAAVPEDQMIVFSPKDPKHTVTVFTDIDCGYCRKLHSQIQDYMKQGIKVRYLFYPRAGLGSESARKAEAVWCARDRRKALTLAKQGKPIEMKTCKNPVAHDFQLGQELGVTGTPSIITEDGELIPGYVPPQRLRQILDQLAATGKG